MIAGDLDLAREVAQPGKGTAGKTGERVQKGSPQGEKSVGCNQRRRYCTDRVQVDSYSGTEAGSRRDAAAEGIREHSPSESGRSVGGGNGSSQSHPPGPSGSEGSETPDRFFPVLRT